MTSILTIVGARPQFVKAAAVSQAIRQIGGIEEILVHTGQHYDRNMSAAFFDQLALPEPHRNLGIGSGTHGAQTGRMLEAIESVIQEVRPDRVLVYGDTNSTLAGALAAAKLHVPIAHVEAGLRSFNRRMPEEINRMVADQLSDLLYAPTEVAVANLGREGISGPGVRLVGDVMLDVVLHHRRSSDEAAVRSTFGLGPDRYVLATIHRQENTDDPSRLRAIFLGLADAARDIPVIVPLHPRTRAAIAEQGVEIERSPGLRLVEPVDYLTMLALEGGAALIVTDSGGVQKEAFFNAVPCLTLRDETEWTELVDCGWNALCPPESAKAVATAIRGRLSSVPDDRPALYGDGTASTRIAESLLE